MFKILFFLFVSIGFGYLFRKVSFFQGIEKSISYTIFVMLFVLGLFIGSNDTTMSHFEKYGYHAAILAFLGVLGSLLISYLAYRIIYRKGGDYEK